METIYYLLYNLLISFKLIIISWICNPFMKWLLVLLWTCILPLAVSALETRFFTCFATTSLFSLCLCVGYSSLSLLKTVSAFHSVSLSALLRPRFVADFSCQIFDMTFTRKDLKCAVLTHESWVAGKTTAFDLSLNYHKNNSRNKCCRWFWFFYHTVF